MQHQSNFVPRRFPGNLVRNPRVFKGDASVDYDFTVIGKFCFFLAWYRTENGSTSFEERFFGKISRGEWVKIPGGSKKDNEKNKTKKKTRHAEHEKLARELVRERTWRPRHAFFLYYDPLRYTFLFACHEISLSARLILSYSNIRASLTTLLKRSSEGERTVQYTILPFITENQCNWDAFHWNEVYIDWFTNLVLLNCQVSITLGNTGAQDFQMRKNVCQMACPPPHCLSCIRIHFVEN